MMIILSYGMKMKNRYLIVTTKSWNIHNFELLKNKFIDNECHLIKDKTIFTYDKVIEINPKYIFFSHRSWKIPKEIYKNFECVSFHMTDYFFPKYKGLKTLKKALENKEAETGTTIHKMTSNIDPGEIID